jgi:hypothetical protein
MNLNIQKYIKNIENELELIKNKNMINDNNYQLEILLKFLECFNKVLDMNVDEKEDILIPLQVLYPLLIGSNINDNSIYSNVIIKLSNIMHGGANLVNKSAGGEPKKYYE